MASEFLVVAEKVLVSVRRSMSAREIVAFAMDHGLFSDNISGRTPHQTMKSKLSQEIRRYGEQSRFVRTAPGRFSLRTLVSSSSDVYEAPPQQKPSNNEQILAIPKYDFYQHVKFQGLNKRWKANYKRLLKASSCQWVDRMAAEQDDSYKQVLAYVAVTRRGSVLCYKRGNYNRIEEYLRGSQCVGFGGHVSRADSMPLFPSADMGVSECVARELGEELAIPSRDIRRLANGEGLSCVGMLNDDSSEVGRRHVAFVFRYEVSADPAWRNPTRGEKSITQLQWLNKRTSSIPIWEFEYWSQLVLRQFFPQLVATDQSYKIVRKRPFQPPHLLCLVGEVGSGKTKTKEILCSQHGYKEVNSGRVVAKLLGIPPVPETARERFQEEAWKFINSTSGPARLASYILDAAASLNHDRVLIDGVRQHATLEHLRGGRCGSNIAVLYVFTPPDIAFSFYANRERQGISFEDYLAIRNAEVEREVPSMIGLADGVLYNWTGQAFHAATLRAMLDELDIN